MADLRHWRPLLFVLPLLLATVCASQNPPASSQNPAALAQVPTPPVHKPFLQQQISQQEQKLAEIRATNNQKEETQQLIDLGSLYSKAGKKQEALRCDDQALALSRALKVRSFEAAALNDLGSVSSDLGQNQKALDY